MRLSKNGENPETLASGKNSLKIEKFINDYIYYSELNEKESYIARVKRDGSDNRVIVKGNNINDFYIGKNNIYYIQNESNINENIVKVDFNGKHELKFNLPENLLSLSIDGGLLAEKRKYSVFKSF